MAGIRGLRIKSGKQKVVEDDGNGNKLNVRFIPLRHISNCLCFSTSNFLKVRLYTMRATPELEIYKNLTVRMEGFYEKKGQNAQCHPTSRPVMIVRDGLFRLVC